MLGRFQCLRLPGETGGHGRNCLHYHRSSDGDVRQTDWPPTDTRSSSRRGGAEGVARSPGTPESVGGGPRVGGSIQGAPPKTIRPAGRPAWMTAVQKPNHRDIYKGVSPDHATL